MPQFFPEKQNKKNGRGKKHLVKTQPPFYQCLVSEITVQFLIHRISAGCKQVASFELATDTQTTNNSLKIKKTSYFKTLKAANIHHVVTALRNHAHHLHSFLQNNMRATQAKETKSLHESQERKRTVECEPCLLWLGQSCYLKICRVKPGLLRNFEKIL